MARLHDLKERLIGGQSTQNALQAQRVLITQRELKNYGGTEFFTVEVARALKQRGREVAIFCPSPGKLANVVTPSGIPVCDALEDVPFTPDIIHGHHHLPTMAALAHFPQTPAIYCWHGARPWVEQPPVHPRIRYFAVTSTRMAPRLATETKMPIERVITIANFVDLERFSRVRDPDEVPKRAVLYGQSGFHPGEIAMLEEACAANDITLDKVGYAYGNPRPRPEYFLPDYDIAFAIGRSALEAMACGCAVIPIVPQLAGSCITSADFDQWSASNFSPRYFTSAEVMSADWLAREIAAIDPGDLRAVTQRVRTEHAIAPAIDAFETLYSQALTADAPEGSGAEFAHYLGVMAGEVDELWGELACRKAEDPANARRITELESRLAEADARVARLTDRLIERDEGSLS